MEMGEVKKSAYYSNKISEHTININYTTNENRGDESKSTMRDFVDETTETECYVPEWNKITSDFIEYEEMNKVFLAKGYGSKGRFLYAKSPSLLAAYAYDTHITVTLTAENYYGKTIYCRYFDCKRREIPNPFNTTVFPEMTVMCGRRAGAEYISVSETLEEIPEYPVPITRRTEPQHFFTVCMATLYGKEPKFIQIADFIEHYRTQGATFFHIYMSNVTEYDRHILDDYVRTGEIQIIKMHDHFWRDDYMWHHPQINDCHHRNKYFSKWTAVVDSDERIEMKNGIPTIAEYLEKVTDPTITLLRIRWQYVVKDQYSPARYINDKQLINDMLFHKFHNSSKVANATLPKKSIIRPERVSIMSIHSAKSVYSGLISLVPPKDMLVRHYRNVDRGSLLQHNVNQMLDQGPFRNTSIDAWMDVLLTQRILERVKNVYANKKKLCKRIQENRESFDSNSFCWTENI